MAGKQKSSADGAAQGGNLKLSRPFVGRWNRLVSDSNWEKGRIIVQWQRRLSRARQPRQRHNDEQWSRLVGDISPQHVGRLRRTFDRFGKEYQSYEGLYWSHFYAALDWPDAEMWLEGAVQNKWSVSQMRRQRWETSGRIPADQPRAREIVVSEPDEGFDRLQLEQPSRAVPRAAGRRKIEGPVFEGPDWGDASASRGSITPRRGPGAASPLPTDLPADIRRAFQSFQTAIERHSKSGWQKISLRQVIDLLDQLKLRARSQRAESTENKTASCATRRSH